MAQSSITFDSHENLQWVAWSGSLPDEAVSIYNDYTKTTDYVCQAKFREWGEPGYYRPSKGPYCYFPWNEKEHESPTFKILVNKDDFEILEWKKGFYGSVPEHSVPTDNRLFFIGKNKYGLGKVDTESKAFFLPYEGKETWYKNYEVLTINRDIQSQKITDVKYFTDKVQINQKPPETVTISRVTNNDFQTVKKTIRVDYTSSVSHTWNLSTSMKMGILTIITTEIPFIGSLGVTMNAEKTEDISTGTTKTEICTFSAAIEVLVPPHHTSTIRLEGRKTTGHIPFTARLTRTYKNGKIRSTTITGKYEGTMMTDFDTMVDRSKPVSKSKSCPKNSD